MGAYILLVVCTGIWVVFAWALVARPVALDRTWGRIRALPLVAKPAVWVVFLPWLAGLAVWESNWRTPHARRNAVALIAIAFIVFWSSTTFGGGASS